MTKYQVSELTGALLDAAVAECGEWKTAHWYFPTMTLDPTFIGWYIYEDSIGESHCMLKPRNAFRQDPRYYSPSTNWEIGGKIIEKHGISIQPTCLQGKWFATYPGHFGMDGDTPLMAAMRVYVARCLGQEVELNESQQSA